MIAEEKRSELEKMDEVRKTLLDAWPRMSGHTRDRPSVRLQVIKGRGQIYRTIREFVAGAKEEVLAFMTTKGLQRTYRMLMHVTIQHWLTARGNTCRVKRLASPD